MASARRIGAPDAKNRVVLLDAAEQLLLEEGYAAVTSRRVAERAGLKPQLVHYYFRTMEDLFLEVFRRRAEEGLGVLKTALESPQPLWALWRFSTHARGHPADDGVHGPGQPSQGAAGRNRLLRRTFPRGAEQGDRRRAASATASAPADVPPVVWTVFATSVSQGLVMERALGMSPATPRRSSTARNGFADSRVNRFRDARTITSCESSRARP